MLSLQIPSSSLITDLSKFKRKILSLTQLTIEIVSLMQLKHMSSDRECQAEQDVIKINQTFICNLFFC